ncbi:MAG TPA: hypothetical protein PKE29_13460 [Phycisphaerales bacterium]|nr:hypothetical protein [Phycisphaerales bacterium]
MYRTRGSESADKAARLSAAKAEMEQFKREDEPDLQRYQESLKELEAELRKPSIYEEFLKAKELKEVTLPTRISELKRTIESKLNTRKRIEAEIDANAP